MYKIQPAQAGFIFIKIMLAKDSAPMYIAGRGNRIAERTLIMAFDILNDADFWEKCAREKSAQARGYNRLALQFLQKGKKELAKHFYEMSENARNAAREALDKYEDARLYNMGFYDKGRALR